MANGLKFNVRSRVRSLGREMNSSSISQHSPIEGEAVNLDEADGSYKSCDNNVDCLPIRKMWMVLCLMRMMIIYFRIALHCLCYAYMSLLTIVVLLLFVFLVYFDSMMYFILIIALKYHGCVYCVKYKSIKCYVRWSLHCVIDLLSNNNCSQISCDRNFKKMNHSM